jgi:hypothetical protein
MVNGARKDAKFEGIRRSVSQNAERLVNVEISTHNHLSRVTGEHLF